MKTLRICSNFLCILEVIYILFLVIYFSMGWYENLSKELNLLFVFLIFPLVQFQECITNSFFKKS